MTFPVLCMDCDAVCGESEVEGSTGLCGECPASRRRLGLELEEDRADRQRREDFDPVAEDTDD